MDNSNITDDNIEKIMTTNLSYPAQTDPDIQLKFYKKREFYYNKVPERPELTSYEDIKDYRAATCAPQEFILHEYQSLLANVINPDTPFKGCVIFHGLGTGKCIGPDSKVYTIINNTVDCIAISKLFESYAINIVFDKENCGFWASPITPIYVQSYDNNNHRMVVEKVNRFYREKISQRMKLYRLSNLKNILCTQIHKLLAFNPDSYLNSYYWTNKIEVGMQIYGCDSESNTLEHITVIGVEDVQYDSYVYDLEINNLHNYLAESIFCHNTCAGVAIAEKFKPLVQKYQTKIHILVPGPLLKENWKHHLIKCTGETYMKKIDPSLLVDPSEVEYLKKNAIAQAMQYYKFLSYKSFYKRVLGEKIVDRSEEGKASYKKTEEGEFERDVSIDRIYNLNNSLIIVDEAHNLTDNAYGEALKLIIKNSTNLKIILMTGTPMKNLASDIVDLVNFLRPLDYPIEREKIFTADKNYELNFKQGGLEYLKMMVSGYISHVRGSDPMVFAKRVDLGEKPNGLLFTKVIRNKMLPFQLETYDKTILESEDALDRKSSAVSNFVFPCLNSSHTDIIGTSGNEGLLLIKNQLKSLSGVLNRKIGEKFFKQKDIKSETEYVQLTQDNNCITGKFLKMPYLKLFSTKFYKVLKNLNQLYWGRKGVKSAFIYSNLVRIGIDMFEQILLQNGYLAFSEDASYQIMADTRCYFCGKTFSEHKLSLLDADENGKTDKKNKTDKIDNYLNLNLDLDLVEEADENKSVLNIPSHTFHPATFITVTGKASEDSGEVIPEEKKRILDSIYNTTANKDGKLIKFILGSKVMNEGISLENTNEVHVLDVYYNFGRVDQVVGRAIRWCSHYKQMTEENPFPEVYVYKYVVSVNEGLSTEEELYKKAEHKYLLIKKVERAMKEVAIDCPLNLQANMFKEEMKEFAKCSDKDGNCPTICDYTTCSYKCSNLKLNAEYYDPERNIYKVLAKSDLDLSTFTTSFAKTEIDFCKKRIKELYLINFMYLLVDILAYVKSSYPSSKQDLFDKFFVYKALDELIPANQNELNSYKDTIVDKNNRTGYLIFIDRYYIFQPFDQAENVPIYYRTTYVKPIMKPISMHTYLKNLPSYKEYQKKLLSEESLRETNMAEYDFESTKDYYENRDENKYVGVIDKDLNLKKSQEQQGTGDLFKLRDKRPKILDKKRGTGIQTLKGTVCTTKDKTYIEKVAKDLKLTSVANTTRQELCDNIRDKMLDLEKNQTGPNKKTYIMIPKNHPVYEFPYNVEDRKHLGKK